MTKNPDNDMMHYRDFIWIYHECFCDYDEAVGKDASYHYINGVYSTKADAMFARDVEVTNREGKYDYSVTECKLDVPTP